MLNLDFNVVARQGIEIDLLTNEALLRRFDDPRFNGRHVANSEIALGGRLAVGGNAELALLPQASARR